MSMSMKILLVVHITVLVLFLITYIGIFNDDS